MPSKHARAASSAEPSSKRRGTQLACHICRARKTGCDGKRPHCTSCVIKGWSFKCDYPEKPSQSPALTFLEIEKRLQQLEGGRFEQDEDFSASINLTSQDQNAPRSTSIVKPPPHAVHQDESHFDRNNLPYNFSSNGQFLREATSIAKDMQETSTSNVERPNHHAIGYPISRPSSQLSRLKDLSLPPRKFTDPLLECYCTFVAPLAPVIHQPSFMAKYEQLWRAHPTKSMYLDDDPMFYATLNIVLALGCQHNEAYDAAEREEMGKEFYERSRKLIDIETIDNYSTSVVTILVLRGLYLLRTPYAERCWSVSGAAITAAVGLGLDTARWHSMPRNQLTRELHRRIWFGCMVLDRIVTTAFGRPPRLSTTKTAVPLPAEVDDEYLSTTDEGRQPNKKPSRLTFVIKSLELSAISERFPKPNDNASITGLKRRYSSQDLGFILDLCAEMNEFLKNLPEHLQYDRVSAMVDCPSWYELQAHVLKTRVIYLRMYLLRPVLLQHVTKASATMSHGRRDEGIQFGKAEDLLRLDICKLCISTAYEVLEELYPAVAGKQRTSPWHCLLFTFAAASVLVAATLCPDLGLNLDASNGQLAWTQALEIFQGYSKFVSSAEKGVEALEKFRTCISRYTNDSRTASVSTFQNGKASSVSTETFDPGSITDFSQDFSDQFSSEFSDLLDSTSLDFSWFTSQAPIF